MNRIVTFLAAAGGAACLASAANAEGTFSPAVVFDMGGKFDRSFNEGVFNGVERFREETGIGYREFEVTNETQREQFMSRLASRDASVIIGVGFAQASAIESIAPQYPDVKFTLIDGDVDLPNVQSVLFKEEEGSFLVGALAAMTTETGHIGFIGGMDIPLIRNFACGYEQGARFIDPEIDIAQNMTGDTPSAWNDPSRGAELAQSQFDRGVDIVYAAAGGTGIGVYQAADDAGMLAIGVDSNQNYLHPGTMLTSMVKRVDVAAYETFMDAYQGEWEAGVRLLGLADDGVDWALDEHNADLVDEAAAERIADLRARIIDGEIEVVSYHAQNDCVY